MCDNCVTNCRYWTDTGCLKKEPLKSGQGK